MGMEVEVDEGKVQGVLDDLGRRRFLVERVEWKHGNKVRWEMEGIYFFGRRYFEMWFWFDLVFFKVIHGTAPLSELMGYSTSLRTISSGLGTYTMQFSHYKHVNNWMDEERIIKETRGF